MTLAEQVTNAAGEVLAPIAENTVARIIDGVTKALRDEVVDNVAQRLSGKELQFTTTVKIPDLTK